MVTAEQVPLMYMCCSGVKGVFINNLHVCCLNMLEVYMLLCLVLLSAVITCNRFRDGFIATTLCIIL